MSHSRIALTTLMRLDSFPGQKSRAKTTQHTLEGPTAP